ncbi:MAG: ABC transporter permease [Planctomycetaceae bacterium]|nr:ABC transporter permease [Planctomycetaceae bacterium]
MLRSLKHIYRLGVKELWGLYRDWILLVLIAYSFTFSIYTSATAVPDSLHNATIAFVDEDNSPLSGRIISAFYPPMFLPPLMISLDQVDSGMDKDLYTFTVDIPLNFQRDVLYGKSPAIQVNVDATRMSQAFTGAGYIQQIAMAEVEEFVRRYRADDTSPVEVAFRNRFNPNLTQSWFGSIMEIINQVTMLSIILTGAALIREREHGTLEHLLVMPVTPTEIMLSKIWSMGLVVLLATGMSLVLVVHMALRVPTQGSPWLFLAGAALHLFATTSLGIFLATLARSMPQFGMLLILVLLPMQMLSGGSTPRESMPVPVQYIMNFAPTTHFVQIGQAILYRGAGMEVVWKYFVWLFCIGAVLFLISRSQFRKSVNQG